MLVEFTCSECGSVLEANAELGGGVQPCPNCGTLLLVPAPAIRPGTTIADFYIERKLGSGAMGDVYLATQLSLQREVALKILPPAFVRDPSHLQRFLHEARLAARLEHPNIVTVYAAGEDNGVYYMAMAYVRGQSLQDYLEKNGPLPERRAFEIIVKIADALDYAWENFRLVHRDIKPANIMVDENGEPKLLDMGLAKCTAVDVGLTAVGLVVGTPAFMSPEQADPKKDVDFRADMYSLGATLYTLVTGQRPFQGKDARTVLREVARGVRKAPIEINPRLSQTGSDIIMRMMARRRQDRYQTWKDLIRAIEAFLANKTPDAPVSSGRAGSAAAVRKPAPVTSVPAPPSPVRPAARTRTGRRIAIMVFAFAATAVALAAVVRLRGRLRLPTFRFRPSEASSPTRSPAPSPRQQPETPSSASAPAPPPPKPVFRPATDQELADLRKRAERELKEAFDPDAAAGRIARELGVSWPPADPVLTRDELATAVATLVQRRLDEQIPPPDVHALEQKAAKKFPISRTGERVTVHLRVPYGTVDKFTGVFMGVRNGKVIIGPKHVPLLNIRKDDLWRIDPEENRKRREQYIQNRLAEIEEQRKQKAADLTSKIRTHLAREAGYVLVDGRWLTPREAVEQRVAAEQKKMLTALFEQECEAAGLVRKNGRWGRVEVSTSESSPAQTSASDSGPAATLPAQ